MSVPIGRVLVVDDDLSLQWLLREYLQTTVNCLAVCVGSVTEAHRLLRDELFDLVICDFQMNGETGADLLERLAAEKIRLPFFLYTSNPTITEDSFTHLDYVFTVIQKPDLDGLLVKVSEVMVSSARASLTRSSRSQA